MVGDEAGFWHKMKEFSAGGGDLSLKSYSD